MTPSTLESDAVRYRQSEPEQLRTADLVRLLPAGSANALDVGARDGHFSRVLTEHATHVTALDLDKPQISHPQIECVKGDITELAFARDSFDLVVCTEVLEHVPPQLLERACSELARVSRGHVLVGVPYKQDIRVGRTTCLTCGAYNPPWGHINVFDEARLAALFEGLVAEQISYVGRNSASTNFVSSVMMDLAGNPYGTYEQEEPCIRCGARLSRPARRSIAQKVFSKCGFWAASLTQPFHRAHPYWIHLLLSKKSVTVSAGPGDLSKLRPAWAERAKT